MRNNKLYIIFPAMLVLASCSTEDSVVPVNDAVVRGVVLPIEQRIIPNAVVLGKKILPENREQYIVRLADGREVYFIANPALNYNIGDAIHLPF